MKKQVSTLLAVAALVGAASAFAANPFSDVSKDSWAYQAVTQLASEGIVVGYPNGTFQGEKNITRYEMAEIIARMMANEDRANAEQRAVINKLAQEFATELNNLGVRVGALENKVGNVKLTGDARVKYESKEEGNKAWTARLRLNTTAQVNETTTAAARLVTKTQFGDSTDNKVEFDRLWVKHNFGAVAVTAGRQGAFLGDGLTTDITFDGAIATAQYGPVAVVAGYGYNVEGNAKVESAKTITFGQIGGSLYNVDLKGYLAKANSENEKIMGFAADTKVGGVGLSAEWAKVTNKEHSNNWVVGGNYNVGPANLILQYFHADKNAAVIKSTWDQTASQDWKGFVATVEAGLAKNLDAKFAYSFKGKHVEKATSNEGLKNSYYAELNYKF